jgi:hypothetical protein
VSTETNVANHEDSQVCKDAMSRQDATTLRLSHRIGAVAYERMDRGVGRPDGARATTSGGKAPRAFDGRHVV